MSWLHESEECLQQRALAGSVGPQQPDRAGIEARGNLLQRTIGSVDHGDPVEVHDGLSG